MDDGVEDTLRDQGWARLCDASGNVWLGCVWGRRKNLFHLWRNGAIAGTVTIPSANDRTPLLSDAPGSVYALTGHGLYHLTVPQGAEPWDYSIDELYHLDGLSGGISEAHLSARGFLAVSTYAQTGPASYGTWIYPLPFIP